MQLIRRNGIIFEGWLEPTFDSGRFSIGAGFGGHSAIDKYMPSAGRHVSGVVSATLSARPFGNFDVRFLWHRIVTDYNRDTDVLLVGFAYRFDWPHLKSSLTGARERELLLWRRLRTGRRGGVMYSAPAWPDITYVSWRDTCLTLQLWTQIVGKIRLGLTPWLNHSWQVPLYVTARGLSTSPIHVHGDILEIEFDFVTHVLEARTSRGEKRALPLKPQSVAEFYAQTIDVLGGMGIEAKIHETPNEVSNPIRFSQDRTHAAYDAGAAQRFWRALIQIDRVLKLFRSGFLGKVSPVHFFWGSFDLAVTRFSGRAAPPHPGGVPGLPDAVAREAYSHEVSSAGFWPGNEAYPQAAFYSYAYPEPPGFAARPVTGGARYDQTLREFILPYEAVRHSADPDALLLDFASSTYAAAADLAKWDRVALECAVGVPGVVRPLAAAEASQNVHRS